MDVESEDGIAADPEWQTMTIAQLKQEAVRLENLAKQLRESRLASAVDATQAKISALRAYMRSKLTGGQKFDSLTATLKKRQKGREHLELLLSEATTKRVDELTAQIQSSREEEADLQKELDECKAELHDNADGPPEDHNVQKALQCAMSSFQQDVPTQAPGGGDLMKVLEKVLTSFAAQILPKAPVPDLVSVDGDSKLPPTLPASPSEIPQMLDGDQEYGAAIKKATALPGPYAKKQNTNGCPDEGK